MKNQPIFNQLVISYKQKKERKKKRNTSNSEQCHLFCAEVFETTLLKKELI